MNRQSRQEFILSTVLRWIGVAFFFLISAFPFYYMVLLSFRSIQSVLTNPDSLIPDQLTLETYTTVLRAVDQGGFGFYVFIRNSVIVSLATTIVTVTVAILAAYAATRLEYRGKNLINGGILLVYMFPVIVLAIPLFVLFSRIGLRAGVQQRLIGLVIVYLSSTLPVAMYMLRSYFQTIPVELEEAAMIDGASRLETIWKIVIPLAVPAIAATSLYVFMIAWNEFLYALLFLLEERQTWTITLGLRQLNSQEVPKTMLMAGSVIITIPVIILFFIAERYLVEGLTAGSVKG